jgi:hypothetical protein
MIYTPPFHLFNFFFVITEQAASTNPKKVPRNLDQHFAAVETQHQTVEDTNSPPKLERRSTNEFFSPTFTAVSSSGKNQSDTAQQFTDEVEEIEDLEEKLTQSESLLAVSSSSSPLFFSGKDRCSSFFFSYPKGAIEAPPNLVSDEVLSEVSSNECERVTETTYDPYHYAAAAEEEEEVEYEEFDPYVVGVVAF